jgi:hypothetical protein
MSYLEDSVVHIHVQFLPYHSEACSTPPVHLSSQGSRAIQNSSQRMQPNTGSFEHSIFDINIPSSYSIFLSYCRFYFQKFLQKTKCPSTINCSYKPTTSEKDQMPVSLLGCKGLSKTEDKMRISSMEEPKAVLHEFARQSKASSNMTDLWVPKSLLVPPKFLYVTNCSPKPPTCSPHTSPLRHKTL